MNAGELFAAVVSLPSARPVPANGGAIVESAIVAGVELAHASVIDERSLRSTWKKRQGGGARPLLLVVDDPEQASALRVLGPRDAQGPVRTISAKALLDVVQRASAMPELQAVRTLAQEVERLDQAGVAGLIVKGLGTQHLYRDRLPCQVDRWEELSALAAGVKKTDWRDVIAALGYKLERQPHRGHLARHDGAPVCVVHPKKDPSEFSRLDAEGRPPEGTLLKDCETVGAPYGVLAAGSRLRLFAAKPETGSAAGRYLDFDAGALPDEHRPLLGLLAPPYLAGDGFASLLREARNYGTQLRERLDRALRQEVLPVLGRALGRWAEAEDMDLADDDVRGELERAALTFVFRALFLLYAESASHLPMGHRAYEEQSFTRTVALAHEGGETLDPKATSLWSRIHSVVEAMRTGNRAWAVPPYNGALFAEAGFEGAETLERVRIPDAALGPALVGLGRDPEEDGAGVDFSGLDIGHLGHIYEGLLSLRLSVADRDYRYNARRDRYLPAEDDEPDVREGELLWLTNEGGRKGGGVYYTREELVRHLVRHGVAPAFDEHLEQVRATAETDPEAAAERLFDFKVLDPACGSAHFLVVVADELADRIATFLGQTPLPPIRQQLEHMQSAASEGYAAGIEDVALLRRLVLKRCVYGVDVSPMGAEIAKVSLWLASFVPGLSLTYLDRNVVVGDSLVGVARPEVVRPPGTGDGQIVLFGDELQDAIRAGAEAAARTAALEDRNPDEVEASEAAHKDARSAVERVARLFDLWAAEPLGLDRARDEIWQNGEEIIEGRASLLADEAGELAKEFSFLHWPLAFPEVFARERPGFDAVVGNPPWEEVTVEELGFYARYAPGLRGMSPSDRAGALKTLLTDRPELPRELAGERARLERLREFLGPAGGYDSSPGDPDLYKLFCQRYRTLLRSRGVLGVVLPRSTFLAKGSKSFREWLFAEASITRLDFLLNKGRWAFDAEERYTVSLLVATAHSANQRSESMEVAGVAESPSAFASQSSNPALHVGRRALGAGLEVPLLPSQRAADLLDKLTGGLFPHGAGGRWRCFPVREFDEANDKKLWENAESGWDLWKGESFDQFDPHGAEARLCPPSDTAMKKAHKPRPGSGSLLAEEIPLARRAAAVREEVGRSRVAFRDVTRATDSRTVRTCLVPPGVFLTNKAPYLTFVDGGGLERAACIGLMNSLAFDWQARRFVETNLNFFILELLRLPSLDDTAFAEIGQAAARLSCHDERLQDFAHSVGVECGPLDVDERERLRVEIDALVSRAWNLTPDDLEVIFEDFTTDAVTLAYRDRLRERLAELAT